MGAVIRPVLSVAKTESGRLMIWYDRTINEVMKRAILTEVKS